ncbi:MAG: adenosylcobalamin-dependent ribonucleoside-diphosphate reductase, partial [Gemmatimonadota bacterium]|nr:adenosylcobalamin-dependent ribonucleoside-diphosphate reductase [Gemmatimonadota bacterium]
PLVARVGLPFPDRGVVGGGGYFLDRDESEAFRSDLKFILCGQRACFNSPVLFNIGVKGERPQASACFINSVTDDMADISRLIVTEGMIFKWGSGSGVNFSTLRARGEPLSTGGTASGPLSFMKVLDANAGAIKSGGKSRRAARMCVLDASHPDVEEFIDCKVAEEKKARALIDAGYDGSLLGEAYTTVSYQNANHSVRITDEFMRAVQEGKRWQLKEVVSGATVRKLEARSLLRRIAGAAWFTGDPGLQFDTTTNEWNTVPGSGRINASNPCGEFVFLDDSACNLASINLLEYVDGHGGFEVDKFVHTVRVMIFAQDILCSMAGYPTPEIARNSNDLRPLGLGYTNLGALLMVHGVPYDSRAGRDIAAAVTALLNGAAYEASGELARRLGPFKAYALNAGPMARVLDRHHQALLRIASVSRDARSCPLMLDQVMRSARTIWERLCTEKQFSEGFRNSQVTLLAPTGTISFFMDAVTTGIEPELSLVKHKNVVDGSRMSLVNPLVRRSLEYMGVEEDIIRSALEHIAAHGGLEDFSGLADEQKAVFATSLGEPDRLTTLTPGAHLKMMAAVQPFLSGAISKTLNLPHSATVEQIEEIFVDAWNLGLKSLAVYRDRCKRSQPLEAGGSRMCYLCGTLMESRGTCCLCPACGSTNGCS